MIMKYDLFELAYFFLRNTINCVWEFLVKNIFTKNISKRKGKREREKYQ